MQARCRRRPPWVRTLPTVAALALSAAAAGCQDRNVGVDPPDRQLVFPSGLFVDTTVTDENGAGRYLFVANGNNDLRFNAGTLAAIDLERFWDTWFDPATATPYAYCTPRSDAPDQCIEPPGGPTTDQRPCRRLALKPQVVECDERPFIDPDLIVHVGDFATVITASTETDADGEFSRLWLPVRGDPSLTYVDVRAAARRRISLDCDIGNREGDSDPLQCGDDHRLRNVRNDESLPELGREPFTMLVTEPADERLAFVAHSSGSQLTLVDLDGVQGGDGRPAIVDQVDIFLRDGLQLGGFGMAERPCFAAGEGDDPTDLEPNVPSITEACTRPMVYAGFRLAPFVSNFTASGLALPAGSNYVAPRDREDCFVSAPLSCGGELSGCTADPEPCLDGGSGCERVYAGQYCATPDQIGQPCAVVCDPQVRSDRTLLPGGLFPSSAGPVLGDVAFADPRGDTLLVLQTNPGALLVVDTSLGLDGEPLDQPSSPPIELCAEPSRMVIYDDAGQRFALVSCFAAALVYVVDLESRRVVDTIVVGTGPHDLAVDEGRQALYVANTLESSVSVVDLSRTRATRFQEVARIGLQEPFEQ
ncbi:MAG: hypothetical protein AAF721_21310 [Myxococcota bacterium]